MLDNKLQFEALGTHWTIMSMNPLGADTIQAIYHRIEDYDRTYSRFRSDSLVSRMKTVAGSYEFPPDMEKMVDFYRQMYDITNGAVTPLIGSMLERAGYDAEYSFKETEQHPVQEWDSILHASKNVLTITKPVVLDFGAAGKGYLIDLVAEILNDAGVQEYVIDASGDMRHRGETPVRIGLEHPNDPQKVIGSFDLKNGSLCASSPNRRTWKPGVHHIFDPRTMQSATGNIATWAIAQDAMIADGLATALFFTSPEKLTQKFDFQFARVKNDLSVEYSNNFKGELF